MMTGAPPIICELIGPAGAGKTTITQAILGMEPRVGFVIPPSAGNVRNILFYSSNSMRLVPPFFHHLRKEKVRRICKILVFLSCLQGWEDRLKLIRIDQSTAFLLEQGPIYMLSCLKIFLLPAVFSQEYQDWRDRIYRRWALTLNAVIWLDAPDEVLIGRVRSRAKDHGNKIRSSLEAVTVNDSYRNSYTEILANLTRINPQLRVHRIDTGVHSVNEIAAQLLPVLI